MTPNQTAALFCVKSSARLFQQPVPRPALKIATRCPHAFHLATARPCPSSLSKYLGVNWPQAKQGKAPDPVDIRTRSPETDLMTPLIQTALGGALGASLRYLTGKLAIRVMGPGFPWGTLTVNVLGSFLMGVLVVALAEKGGNRFAPLLMTGFLGGFTTFSAFSLDAVTLMERGQHVVALSYVLASVLVSIVALMAGLAVSRGAFL